MFKNNYFIPVLLFILIGYVIFQTIGYNKEGYKTLRITESGDIIPILKSGFYFKNHNDYIKEFKFSDTIVVSYKRTFRMEDGNEFEVMGDVYFVLPNDEKQISKILMIYQTERDLSNVLHSEITKGIYRIMKNNLSEVPDLSKIESNIKTDIKFRDIKSFLNIKLPPHIKRV